MLPKFHFLIQLQGKPAREVKVMSNDPETAAHTALLSTRFRQGDLPLENMQFLGFAKTE